VVRGVARKDAWWLNYFAFLQPVFPLCQILSDYKFQRENFSEMYKYFQKSILEQICSLPNRKTLQITLQIFNKLEFLIRVYQLNIIAKTETRLYHCLSPLTCLLI
jgi:hypothetical protein